jgi:hypothetical protein
MKYEFIFNKKRYSTLGGKVSNLSNKIAVIFSPGYDSIGYGGNRTDAFMAKLIIENGGRYIRPGTNQHLQVRFVPKKIRYMVINKNGYESIILENEIKFESV